PERACVTCASCGPATCRPHAAEESLARDTLPGPCDRGDELRRHPAVDPAPRRPTARARSCRARVVGPGPRRLDRLARPAASSSGRRSPRPCRCAGRVAHDIVSPLGPVSVGVQYLARKLPDDPEAQGAVRIVRGSLDRVGIIVDELLRFARAGARPARGECADLPRVIDALRDELLPATGKQGISLTLEPAPPAPPVRVACSEA